MAAMAATTDTREEVTGTDMGAITPASDSADIVLATEATEDWVATDLDVSLSHFILFLAV